MSLAAVYQKYGYRLITFYSTERTVERTKNTFGNPETQRAGNFASDSSARALPWPDLRI